MDLEAVDRASIDLPEAEDMVAGLVLERRLGVCLLLIFLWAERRSFAQQGSENLWKGNLSVFGLWADVENR